MKKSIALGFLMAAFAATPIFAAGATVRSEIPFEFIVNGNVMPAGTYDVVDERDGRIMRVVSVDGKNSAMILTSSEQSVVASAPAIAFRTVNGKRYLAGVTRLGTERDVRTPAANGLGTLAYIKASVR